MYRFNAFLENTTDFHDRPDLVPPPLQQIVSEVIKFPILTVQNIKNDRKSDASRAVVT